MPSVLHYILEDQRLMGKGKWMGHGEIHCHVCTMVPIYEEEVCGTWCPSRVCNEAQWNGHLLAALDACLDTYIMDCISERIMPLRSTIS